MAQLKKQNKLEPWVLKKIDMLGMLGSQGHGYRAQDKARTPS